MIKAMADWFDHRTGHRKLLSALLIEDIPGGAKWRYVWGSCLVTVFLLQLITGLLLVTAYSPGASTAWASVYFIQYQMDFGWLIRGIHHFGSQAMVVLLALHVLQVVIAGAHLPPREINWWLGLALLGAVLGLSLTGYLLPWDQKGYWATQVATNIAGNLPVVGPWLQKIIVGGPNYGHHTLTRFYTLHVAVLPPMVLLLIGAHVALFRRHGVTPPKKAEGQGWFWPDQAFRDMLIGLAVFAVILGVAMYKHGHAVEGPAYGGADESLWQSIAHAGRDGRGANLDAPADPGQAYPARPEWYFLSLFQLLKYFEGPNEIVGTVFIPAGVGAALAILPLLGYGRMRKFGHFVGVLTIAALLIGALTLTVLGLGDDQPDPHRVYSAGRGVAIVAVLALVALAVLRRTGRTLCVLGITTAVAAIAVALNAYLIQDEHDPGQRARAVLHQDQLASAQAAAQRAIALADLGIPPSGPVQLLRRDPMTRGQALFGQHCASCHNYGALFTDGNKAADLENVGTEAWILGLLRNPGDPKYFGHTELTKMADWAEENLTTDFAELSDEEKADLHTIAKWLAGHPTSASPDAPTEAFQKGLTAFQEAFGRRGCVDCHGYEGEGGKQRGPDFTGYMSADWIRAMVMSADHKLRYGDQNAMPIFLDLDGPAGTSFRLDNHDRKPSVQHLGTIDRELIIRWLVKDYRPVFGGDPISAPPAP